MPGKFMIKKKCKTCGSRKVATKKRSTKKKKGYSWR